jgi:hypothetical protein
MDIFPILILAVIWVIGEIINHFHNQNCKPEDLNCPVCGYYCLGKGGIGCIDKLSAYKKTASGERE